MSDLAAVILPIVGTVAVYRSTTALVDIAGSRALEVAKGLAHMADIVIPRK